MDQKAQLNPIREVMQKIRNAADAALKQLDQTGLGFSVRWMRTDCRYVKTFTKPVDLEPIGRCPPCKSTEFRPV